MKIRDYYDRVADERTENYQESSGWMDALVHRPNERFVRRTVHQAIEHAASVADFGCGAGWHLLGSFSGLGRLFLNDLSPNMLEGTAGRLRQAHPNVEIDTYCGPLESVPGDTAPCEAAICLGVINHIRDDRLPEAIDVFARMATRKVLVYYAHEGFLLSSRVGGTFRAMDIHYEAIARARMIDLFRERGFELARASYAFRLPWISPLVIQEFHAGGTAGA